MNTFHKLTSAAVLSAFALTAGAADLSAADRFVASALLPQAQVVSNTTPRDQAAPGAGSAQAWFVTNVLAPTVVHHEESATVSDGRSDAQQEFVAQVLARR